MLREASYDRPNPVQALIALLSSQARPLHLLRAPDLGQRPEIKQARTIDVHHHAEEEYLDSFYSAFYRARLRHFLATIDWFPRGLLVQQTVSVVGNHFPLP
jgi:hypothetical protein